MTTENHPELTIGASTLGTGQKLFPPERSHIKGSRPDGNNVALIQPAGSFETKTTR
jgi:hypothetical protein